MPRSIIKIKDKYFEWSTVVDAPVTYAMTLAELKKYYKNEYGKQGFSELANRLERVEDKGTSSRIDSSVASEVKYNHAGKDGTRITIDQIYEFYQNEESYKNIPLGVDPLLDEDGIDE